MHVSRRILNPVSADHCTKGHHACSSPAHGMYCSIANTLVVMTKGAQLSASCSTFRSCKEELRGKVPLSLLVRQVITTFGDGVVLSEGL